MEKDKTRMKRYCINCRTPLQRRRVEDGCTRLQCPQCGAVIFSTLKSRRREDLSIFSPYDGIT